MIVSDHAINVLANQSANRFHALDVGFSMRK